MTYTIHEGDCIASMKSMPEKSVHCCVTSPPYFGLRDYGNDGQIGLEESPDAYVAKMVEVFREVRRVLRDDGTVWLNLGDSYAGGGTIGRNDTTPDALARRAEKYGTGQQSGSMVGAQGVRKRVTSLKHKDLIGIPWRVAFALQADGWYLRQDIIWHKPNPMPESVRDRCTKAHEYIFLLSKNERYYFDSEAMQEPAISAGEARGGGKKVSSSNSYLPEGSAKQNLDTYGTTPETRNRRSVWTVATKPYSGAHFATFPKDLIRPCILAGCPIGGTVLDPFGGSGTTAQVAIEEQRSAILCELNPDYIALAEKRLSGTQVKLM
jgi:DNA modification methylase